MTEIKIVIGANYGDEGKGLMTDYFCHNAMQKTNKCLVVCSNGGAQRGHTVETPEGIRHVFHHFGSGTLVGADTYLSEKFILNPMIFREEYLELEKLGFTPKVYVNGNCIITTPYDMILNQYIEDKRGEDRHGSCGCGIWETIVRNSPAMNDDITTRLKLFEVFELINIAKETQTTSDNMCFIKSVLLRIKNKYIYQRLNSEIFWEGMKQNEIIDELKKSQWWEVIDSSCLLENYISDLEFMLSKIEVAENNILKNYEQIVFENGQGLLLDKDIKDGNINTTPSNTGIKNPMEIIQSVWTDNELKSFVRIEACYVTRTYVTRHGAGNLEYERKKEDIDPYMNDITNHPNPYQGKLRYAKIHPYELDTRIINDFNLFKFYKSKNILKLITVVTHANETNGKYCTPSNMYVPIIETYVSDGKTRNSIMTNREFRKKWGV